MISAPRYGLVERARRGALGVALCLSQALTQPALAQPAPLAPSAAADAPETSPAAVPDGTLSFAPVPLASYAPETSAALGLLFVAFRDVRAADERPSNLELLGIVTARRQLLLELSPDLYWDEQRFHVWHKLEYQYYPDRFFGVGNQLPNHPVSYTRRVLRGRLLLERRVLDKLWLGGFSEALSVNPEYGAAGSRFEAISGRAGGLAVGAGPWIAWDTRDSALAASRGTLLALTLTAYPHWLGGDYAFWRVNADAREALALGEGHVLALHALLQRNSARVPYYMMGQLGGADLLRGYYLGRYRDRALGVLEAEYRTPFVWRLGAAVFGGVGRVGEDVTRLRLDQLHPSMGAGLRLNVARAERLNLRADAGVGSDGPALYLGVGEAF